MKRSPEIEFFWTPPNPHTRVGKTLDSDKAGCVPTELSLAVPRLYQGQMLAGSVFQGLMRATDAANPSRQPTRNVRRASVASSWPHYKKVKKRRVPNIETPRIKTRHLPSPPAAQFGIAGVGTVLATPLLACLTQPRVRFGTGSSRAQRLDPVSLLISAGTAVTLRFKTKPCPRE